MRHRNKTRRSGSQGKISRVGKPLLENAIPLEGLALTKCPGEAAIGPARRNLNSPQAPPEEIGPP